MTALDIIVLLLVGGLGVRGFIRGFTTEALSLGAWVLAIVAVKLLHAPATEALTGVVGTTGGAAVLAFALIFGISFIAARLLAARFGNAARTSALGAFDRVLGLGFGALKGLIGATLIFLVATILYNTRYGGRSERPAWMRDAATFPLLNATSGALVEYAGERQSQRS